MIKRFDIFGDIVDTEAEKITTEDICPSDFKSFLETVDDNDIVEIHINSCGGSVTGGISIANMILGLSKKNIRTIAYVDGLAASIASVIACAVDDLHLSDSSFLMIHRVWGTVQGNCEDLRKEANIMEMMTKSLLSFYHRKFDLTDDELNDYLKAETWISGSDIKQFKLDAIVDMENEVRYAAKLIEKVKDKFHNKTFIERISLMENKIENSEVTETVEEEKKEETVIEPVEEEKKDEPVEEKTTEETTAEDEKSIEDIEKENEELKKEIETLKAEIESLKTDDVEKRVSGMQSKMQNKINDITKEFKNKLEATEKELTSYKNEVISLKDKLDIASKEFSEMKSAYEEKKNALAELNANVNTPNEFDKNGWKNLKGEKFFAWLDANKDTIKNIK